MDYLEIKLVFSDPEPWKEVFTSLLANAGCDSFIDGEDENTLLAYIPKDLFQEEEIKDILDHHEFDVKITYLIQAIETQNWNAIWESNYEPVLIANRCYIRAPFHERMRDVDFEIVIEPKMSFGTAHHETTSLMIEYILEEDLAYKRVLEMGAGTGILAILAFMKGAFPVTAIDNDEWAYLNNIENNSRNNAEPIIVKLGDAKDIEGDSYEVIIANINRNILLADLPAYYETLTPNGIIFLSGFYVVEDLEKIREKCESLGLKYVSHKEKNRWCSAKFVKL